MILTFLYILRPTIIKIFYIQKLSDRKFLFFQGVYFFPKMSYYIFLRKSVLKYNIYIYYNTIYGLTMSLKNRHLKRTEKKMSILEHTQSQNNIYKYNCEKCNFRTNICPNWERHLSTKKHNKNVYTCELCNYICSKYKHYTQHLETKKHLSKYNKQNRIVCNKEDNTLYIENQISNTKNKIITTNFVCDLCNYTCKTKGLYKQHLQTKKHNKNIKTVDVDVDISTNENNDTQNKIIPEYVTKILSDYNEQTNKLCKIIEQQNDTNKQLLEIVKTPQTIIYNNQKTINNTFNLNNFLNMDCSEAPNLKDFIFSLQIGRTDLCFLQENGYIKSYENVIVKQLENMDQTKRPLHCLDQKRKKFIMKDKNVWTKENIEKTLRLSIDHFSNLLLCEYNKWKDDHPEWKENTEDELFDIGLFLSNEILSPYNEKKMSKIESHILQNMLNLTIQKKNNIIQE